ncbi:FAD-dependent oxidoreductase [Streptomyces sp. NPDC048277]|uniref:FAD-dependent oxidoreductase n=1 Tax=Streptomyces sp. NPDC048277 TaxID=3155027 RepID=UPI003405D92A
MEEFIVIGAGLAGASTAWHLSARGHQVTVLERAEPGNPLASSHGSARIFRYAYPNPLYTGLVVRARRGWDELERVSGAELLTEVGSVDHGDLRDPYRLAAGLAAHDIEHDILTAAEASERWPYLRFDTDVLWHPGAGVLDAIGSVQAMLRVAEATGNARVLTGWPVHRMEPVAGGYRVHTADGRTLDGAHVVVTAGGWLPTLLGELSLPAAFLDRFPPFEIRQEQVFHFPYRDLSADGEPETVWPSFIYKGSDIQTYGLPGGRDAQYRGHKVAEYKGGPVIPTADDHHKGVIEPGGRARIVDFVSRLVPGVEPESYAEATCLFTLTPSEDFVFDRVDGITVVSPCSGHGAKFAPLLGELAADLATGAGDVPAEFRLAAHAAAAAGR